MSREAASGPAREAAWCLGAEGQRPPAEWTAAQVEPAQYHPGFSLVPWAPRGHLVGSLGGVRAHLGVVHRPARHRAPQGGEKESWGRGACPLWA